MQRTRFPAEGSARLERSSRYQEIQPEQLIHWATVPKGAVVLDVGCGSGFFTRAAAVIAGETGRVIGLDVNWEMLRQAARLTRERQVLWVQSEDHSFPLATNSVDAVVLGFVLHEVQEPRPFLSEVRRVLRDGGKLLVVEWAKREEDRGPAVQERISEKELRRLLAEQGFATGSVRAVGQSYYAAIAEKIAIRCCGFVSPAPRMQR